MASTSSTNADRRERLRKLALETIDLDKDPYFFKNHVGSFECRLCLTVHQNDGSYLAHTQGRKHQTNLARRAAREQKEGKGDEAMLGLNLPAVRRNMVKIGRPGYKITKVRDPLTRQNGLLFQLQYPEISQGVKPRVRFMSAYEQKQEEPDKVGLSLMRAVQVCIRDPKLNDFMVDSFFPVYPDIRTVLDTNAFGSLFSTFWWLQSPTRLAHSSYKRERWIGVKEDSGLGSMRTAKSFGPRCCSRPRERKDTAEFLVWHQVGREDRKSLWTIPHTESLPAALIWRLETPLSNVLSRRSRYLPI